MELVLLAPPVLQKEIRFIKQGRGHKESSCRIPGSLWVHVNSLGEPIFKQEYWYISTSRLLPARQLRAPSA